MKHQVKFLSNDSDETVLETSLGEGFGDGHLSNLVSHVEQNEGSVDVYIKIGTLNPDHDRINEYDQPFVEIKNEAADQLQLNHIQHFLRDVAGQINKHNQTVLDEEQELARLDDDIDDDIEVEVELHDDIEIELDDDIEVELDDDIEVELDDDIEVEVEKTKTNPPMVPEVNERAEHHITKIELAKALGREQSLIYINNNLQAQLGVCLKEIEELKTLPVPAPEPETKPWNVEWNVEADQSQALMRSATVKTQNRKNHL